MAVSHSEAEPAKFNVLALDLLTVLPISLALCSQVLYHGKCILSVWNNQGNKKLALSRGKGSSNCLIDTCEMLTYCSLSFPCCRSKGYMRAHVMSGLL